MSFKIQIQLFQLNLIVQRSMPLLIRMVNAKLLQYLQFNTLISIKNKRTGSKLQQQ